MNRWRHAHTLITTINHPVDMSDEAMGFFNLFEGYVDSVYIFTHVDTQTHTQVYFLPVGTVASHHA